MFEVSRAVLQVFGVIAIAVLCLAVAGAERRLLQGKTLSKSLLTKGDDGMFLWRSFCYHPASEPCVLGFTSGTCL